MCYCCHGFVNCLTFKKINLCEKRHINKWPSRGRAQLMERKAGGHGSQRALFPVNLQSVQLACFPVSLHIRGQLACLLVSLCTGLCSHASRSVTGKQLSARHLLQPLKPRHLASHEWLIECTWFELYKHLRY